MANEGEVIMTAIMTAQIKKYILSPEAYPIIGAFVDDAGTFAAYHADRQICIAGVIVKTLTDAAIEAACKYAGTVEVAVEGTAEEIESIPCVIASHVDLSKVTPNRDVLLLCVNFINDKLRDTYVTEWEAMI